MRGISVVCQDSDLTVADFDAGVQEKIFIVGITGGIGSGKSTVSQLFVDLGATAIDADEIAKALTLSEGRAMPILKAEFGAAAIAPDGALNRAAMRLRVFADAGVKARLEAILHPMIREETQRRIAAAVLDGAPYILLEIPLLFEGMSYRHTLSRTLTIDCPTATQIDRVRRRSALSDAEVSAIMAAQIPRALRLQLTDDLIENVGDQAGLMAAVTVLHKQYCALAARNNRMIDKNVASEL